MTVSEIAAAAALVWRAYEQLAGVAMQSGATREEFESMVNAEIERLCAWYAETNAAEDAVFNAP